MTLALVIEDDEDLGIIFTKALEAARFTVKAFFTAETAWDYMEQIPPQLVVLDLNLPGRSGHSMLQEIRADGRFTKTRIILATANHLLAQTLTDQADLVLVKPITFSQLRDLTSRFHDT